MIKYHLFKTIDWKKSKQRRTNKGKKYNKRHELIECSRLDDAKICVFGNTFNKRQKYQAGYYFGCIYGRKDEQMNLIIVRLYYMQSSLW